MMEVYLVVVALQPTKKQRDEEGANPIIVVPVTAIVAKDENQAAMKAVRLVPSEHADKEDRLEVRVLPFPKSHRS
jgi:hypothetical protein